MITLSSLSNRQIFGALVLFCCFLMSVGFYMQYGRGLEPCPLCMTQRVFIVLAGFFALLAALHNPGRAGTYVYASLTLIAAVAGGAFSTRQVYLQHLPADQVPACGPSLSYMLETFPLNQTLTAMLSGDGNCAEVLWSFLGLGIPAWTLVAFAMIVGAATTILVRTVRSTVR